MHLGCHQRIEAVMGLAGAAGDQHAKQHGDRAYIYFCR
jgi:hypothetical protein